MKIKDCFENILLVLTIFFGIQTNVVFSQEAEVIPATKEELEKKYQENILQTRLYGTYIPKDVEDAFNEFISLSPEEEILKFKNAEEDLVAKKLHYSLGRWMALNWCFYEGSRLSHHLREKGIGHPDDMIAFLLRVFHRQLNNKPLEEDKIILELKAARKKLIEENLIRE
jgi:hypothetical protein